LTAEPCNSWLSLEVLWQPLLLGGDFSSLPAEVEVGTEFEVILTLSY